MDYFRALFLAVIAVVLLFLSTNCYSDRKTQLYKPEEANTLIAVAYLAKDFECGVTHFFTVPIFAEAEIDDVNLCVASIMATTCTDWTAEKIPELCLAIQVDL